MKNKLVFVLAALVLLFGGPVMVAACSTTSAVETSGQVIKDISPQESYQLIQSNQGNPDFVVLDVRTPEEYAEAHLAGAENLNFLDSRFRDNADALDKDNTYVVYCRTGGRSASAVDVMRELGFKTVYNQTGGIVQWQEEGLPVVK